MCPTRRLLPSFARSRWSLLGGGLCVLGSAVFSLIKPAIIGRAVDRLATAASGAAFVRYGLAYVAAAAVEGLFLYAYRWIIIGASRRIEFDMRNDFYAH